MVFYDGKWDKKLPSTTHTVLPVSVGKCEYFDMPTIRKNGRKDWSLFYCEEGILKFDDTEIHAGQVWLYPPDVPQKYFSLNSNNTIYHYLHFTGSDISQVIDSLKISVLTPLDAPMEYFSEIFKKIEKNSVADDALSQITTEYYTLRLLTLLSKIAPHFNKKSLMMRATEEMSHNYPRPYDATKYAKMFSMSVGRFNHLFKEVIGISPQKYYTNLRMENACQLIEYTDLSIKEIGQKVGYENHVYFSQAFKKHTGRSPIEYRKCHK